LEAIHESSVAAAWSHRCANLSVTGEAGTSEPRHHYHKTRLLGTNEGSAPHTNSSTYSERFLCQLCAPLLVKSSCRCETPLQACPLYLKTNTSCLENCGKSPLSTRFSSRLDGAFSRNAAMHTLERLPIRPARDPDAILLRLHHVNHVPLVGTSRPRLQRGERIVKGCGLDRVRLLPRPRWALESLPQHCGSQSLHRP